MFKIKKLQKKIWFFMELFVNVLGIWNKLGNVALFLFKNSHKKVVFAGFVSILF